MNVRSIPFTFPPDVPRRGVHFSDIQKDLLRALDPKRYGQPIDAGARANFERGFSFEDSLRLHRLWPAHVLTQQEFERDGIICTLDGFDARNEIVYESKCTLISSGRDILDEKFIGWKWQLLAYCYVSSVRRAFLDVLHLCGDWNPPRTIPPVRWEWEFEKRELEGNWRMLTRHRDRMVKEGRIGKR